MKCVEQCNTNNVGWWEIRWSPNGRYLAFPGMLEGDSSDLYVYDVILISPNEYRTRAVQGNVLVTPGVSQ